MGKKFDKEYFRIKWQERVRSDAAFREKERARQRLVCHNNRLKEHRIRKLYYVDLPVPSSYLIWQVLLHCEWHRGKEDYEILEEWIKGDLIWEESEDRQDQVEKCIFLYFRYCREPEYYAGTAMRADEFVEKFWVSKNLRKLEKRLGIEKSTNK